MPGLSVEAECLASDVGIFSFNVVKLAVDFAGLFFIVDRLSGEVQTLYSIVVRFSRYAVTL